ncbi:MAG TPA: cytochrome P450 [Acidimicrobiales bacterium]|nr:cytochrome P450 [Acidimicrobiales bacterium]
MTTAGAKDISQRDFFTDESLLADPYPYYEALRAKCPVHQEPNHGVLAITGYDEAVDVYRDPVTFSACNSPTGPFPGVQVPPGTDDASEAIEAARDRLPMGRDLPTLDPPEHTRARGLMMRLLTPRRLKENEAYIRRLADQLIDDLAARRACEFIHDFADPFSFLVIADLLGVPDEDRWRLHDERLARMEQAGAIGEINRLRTANPQAYLHEAFAAYVEDRRRNPRDDVLTAMANATYPDGSTPPTSDVVRTAAFLFVAGQETTVRHLAFAAQAIAEHPHIQEILRREPDRIPNFVEEMLRLESPIKANFRLARHSTEVAGLEVPAGTPLMFLNGAINRDPRHFENPDQLDIDRPNARHHLAFGQGVHSCPGAPLARTEGRIAMERLLARLRDITVSDAAHGPAGDRHYEYVPTYLFRGTKALHLEYTPAEAEDG